MAGTSDNSTVRDGSQALRRKLALTRAGIAVERAVRAFWPAWSLGLAALALALLGVPRALPPEGLSWMAGALGLAWASLVLWGARQFQWPNARAARARIDAATPGRPLAALDDRQVIGRGDAGSEALWRAHLARMRARAAAARAVRPDLRLARFDPLGLRYVAATLLVIGLILGQPAELAGLRDSNGTGAGALAAGPAWEGWVEPPRHTGRPSLYLADIEGALEAPEGSAVVLRLYGAAGALEVRETVSDRPLATEAGSTAATASEQRFAIARTGRLEIAGPGGESWEVTALPDRAPKVTFLREGARTRFDGQMSQPFRARDDYGIAAGTARFTLDLGQVTRRHGLKAPPEPRDPIVLDLPLPIAGDRAEFTETLVENLSKHPWAHLPVTLTMRVEDASGQNGQSAPAEISLPARRFFDPIAAAVIEQRRDLLWTRANAPRVARVLRALSWQPDAELIDPGAYLRFRAILRDLERHTAAGTLDGAARDAIAEALWKLGVQIEDGDVGDALERMRQAQERLNEAMRNGASPDEIARLMQELRDATQDYMRKKMQQAQRDGGDRQDRQGETLEMTREDLERMMDRIQELMNQGRFAEAQQALEQFQRMMENMQVRQGGQGRSPGQQAMEGLADTLREQQGLSDQAFRDLQEQFNPQPGAGESEGNEGQSGGLGRGQSHEGQRGRGQGRDGAPGETPGARDGTGGSLADRQAELRRRLQSQRDALPGLGGEAGDAAREQLGRADRAMDDAEDALRGDDLAGALDRQSEAMEALREGMRNLGEALARRDQNSGRGQAMGQPGQRQSDPLGRAPGQGRNAGTRDDMLQGADVYRRARELLDEIRRRTGEGERPEQELDYLERLLERF